MRLYSTNFLYKLLPTSCLIFLCTTSCICQKVGHSEKQILGPSTPVYDSATMELIPYKVVSEMIRKNPNLGLKPNYNRYGDLDSYIYEPHRGSSNSDRDPHLRDPIGQRLKEFVFKDLKNKQYSLTELRGKKVIVHFEMITNPRILDTLAFQLRAQLFNDLMANQQHMAFVLFIDGPGLITKNLAVEHFKFPLIPDSQNFGVRYHIVQFPTTILIDQNGRVVNYLEKTQIDKWLEIITNFLNY